MSHTELLEALWAAVEPGTEPEGFAWRRDWLLGNVAPGQRVLDLGCGEGFFSEALLSHGAHVVAADVVAEPLRRAAARVPGLTTVRMALDGPLVLDDGAFDVVWAGEVVEHVVDVAGWLSEVRRVLPSGGRLLLTTPDLDAPDLDDLVVRDAIFDPSSDHVRFFSARTLHDAVAAAGFEAIGISPGEGPAAATILCDATRARF